VSPAVSIVDLTKFYGRRLGVRDVTFEVAEGEVLGFLGPNGAGKTTTMEILEGLLAPTAGQVEVLGRQWSTHDRELREKIGVSLQETNLSDKLTVLEIARLFRSFFSQGLSPDEALAQVSLQEKQHARFGKLSGGQKQRLAVACALVGDPELLFLDEPTTGLDPQSRRQLWSVIEGFREAHRTVILTTHYMDEAEKLCHRVAIVDGGRVIALGSPRELIARLGSEHVLEPAWQGPPPPDAELLALPSVTQVLHESGHLCLAVAEPHRALPALLDHTRATGRELASLTTRHATLEDVFVALTGRHLRDTTEVRA